VIDRHSTAELVRKAKAGDDWAFSELVLSHQDVAVAYATAILGDYHLAEDAAQEAFVEVHRSLHALREPAAFPEWLRTIIFKYCDRIARRRQHHTTGLDSALQLASPDPSPHDDLERETRTAALWQSITSLTEVEREVVLLYYMGEQSYDVVAALLGVGTNTVKTRLYSARQRLKARMGQIEKGLQNVRPSRTEAFARRVISAALRLQLYFLDSTGTKHAAGSTVAARTPEVPQAGTWLVEPRQELSDRDWDTIVRLMEEMKIPGLSAAGQLTDSSLERLSHVQSISYLDLSGCAGITDIGLRNLARLPHLSYLNLGGTEITDAGLAILRHLPGLKTFEIAHQRRVSDEGIIYLNLCDSLETVNLMGTATGDPSIKALAGKERLRTLFAGTNLSDSGLAALHDFPTYKAWRGGEAAMSLLSFQSHPNYLWLNLKSPLTDKGLANLAGLDGLWALNLFGSCGAGPFDATNSALSPEGLRYLSILPNLKWLGCNAQLGSDEALDYIGGMPGLRFLMCQDTIASDHGFRSLSRSQTIEYIWGRRCYGLSGSGFSSLAAMPQLRGLAVSCRNVDDQGLSSLPDFPSLVELMPIDISDEGFRHVGRCSSLEALHCMYCTDTTDAATSFITSLHRLKTYQAWRTGITDRSLEMLSRLPLLHDALFSGCTEITDAGLAFLAHSRTLREATLEKLTGVSADAAAIFPTRVRVNYLP